MIFEDKLTSGPPYNLSVWATINRQQRIKATDEQSVIAEQNHQSTRPCDLISLINNVWKILSTLHFRPHILLNNPKLTHHETMAMKYKTFRSHTGCCQKLHATSAHCLCPIKFAHLMEIQHLLLYITYPYNERAIGRARTTLEAVCCIYTYIETRGYQ